MKTKMHPKCFLVLINLINLSSKSLITMYFCEMFIFRIQKKIKIIFYLYHFFPFLSNICKICLHRVILIFYLILKPPMYDLNIGDKTSNTNQSIRRYSDYYSSKWEIKKLLLLILLQRKQVRLWPASIKDILLVTRHSSTFDSIICQ